MAMVVLIAGSIVMTPFVCVDWLNRGQNSLWWVMGLKTGRETGLHVPLGTGVMVEDDGAGARQVGHRVRLDEIQVILCDPRAD